MGLLWLIIAIASALVVSRSLQQINKDKGYIYYLGFGISAIIYVTSIIMTCKYLIY